MILAGAARSSGPPHGQPGPSHQQMLTNWSPALSMPMDSRAQAQPSAGLPGMLHSLLFTSFMVLHIVYYLMLSAKGECCHAGMHTCCSHPALSHSATAASSHARSMHAMGSVAHLLQDQLTLVDPPTGAPRLIAPAVAPCQHRAVGLGSCLQACRG